MGNVGSVTVGVRGDSSEFRADMVANQKLVADFAQKAQQAGQQAAAGLAGAGDGAVILSKGLEASTIAAGTLTSAMTVLKTAISTAFPLFGALALLDVLEKIADNKFAQVAQNIGDGFRSMNLSMESSADLLKESTARMQEQLDILGGKRPNLLAEQLADASIEADKLATKLDDDNRKIEQLLTRDHLSGFQGLVTNRAGTADVEGSIKSFNEQIAHLAAVYQHAVRANDPNADQALKNLTDKQAAAQNYQQSQLRARQQAGGPKQDANIAELTGFGDTLTDIGDYAASEKENRDTAVKLRTVQDQNKADAMQREAERKSAAAAKKAQEELLKQDENAEKAQNAFNKLTINEEIAFWNDRTAAFTNGSDEYIKVQDKIYDLIAKRPDLTKENKKNQAQAGKSQVQGDDLLGNAAAALQKIQEGQYDRSTKSAQQYNDEVAKGNAEQEKANTVFAETSVQIALAQGSMSQLGAAQALAAIHAHDHAAEIEIVNQKLAEQIRLINAMPDDKLSAQDKANAIRNARQVADNSATALNGSYAVTQARDKAGESGATISGAVRDALNEMVKAFDDMATQLKDVLPRTINSMNEDIVKAATGRGKASDFGRTFTQAGDSLFKAGLQGVEGKALGYFGLGPKSTPGSSPANPIYTIEVGGGAGAQGSLGGILGGAIGHIPGVGSGPIPNFLTSLLPHFASGGQFSAGQDFVAGEGGKPEVIHANSGGSVTPVDRLGGDTHIYHVDARGSTDPAAVHAAVARALPHAVAASVHTVHQRHMRTPHGR